MIYHISLTGDLIASFPRVDDARDSVAVDRSNDSLWGSSEKRVQIVNYSKTGQPISVINSFNYDSASGQPEGVDVDDSTNTLWVVDDITLRVSNITKTGTLLSSFMTTDFDPRATSPQEIAWDPNGTLWVCDNRDDVLHNVTTSGQMISSIDTNVFDSGISNLQGVSVDRTDGTLWTTARNTRMVYHIATDGTLISSFSVTLFGSTDPTGVAYDGNGQSGTDCTFTPYGDACGISLAGSAVTGYPNHAVTMDLTGAPSNSIGALVIGVADTNGSPISGSSCSFYIQPPLAVLSVIFDGAGAGSRTLAVDATAPLTVSFQGAFLAVSTTVTLGTSNGVTLTCVDN